MCAGRASRFCAASDGEEGHRDSGQSRPDPALWLSTVLTNAFEERHTNVEGTLGAHYLIADAPYVTGETLNVDGGRHVVL